MPVARLEQLGRQVRAAAGRRRADAELAGLALGERDELGDVVRWQRWIGDDADAGRCEMPTGAKSLRVS